MFNFNFGKKRPDRNQIIVVSIVLSGIVATLSQCTGASSERLWDLLDEVQRTLFPQTVINDVLLQDPNIIKRRVERDFDKAIRLLEQAQKLAIQNYPLLAKIKTREALFAYTKNNSKTLK